MEARIPQYLAQQRGFASTHWTTIRACAGNDTVASAARERLCRDYWYPLYAYIRRSGHQECDAEDVIQEFFEYLLSRPWFLQVDPSKGRFRSFLLATLNHFLKDRFASKRAYKRGGGYQHIPLDMGHADFRYAQVQSPSAPAGDLYEAEWASAVIAGSLRRVEAEYEAAGKSNQYRWLKRFMTSEGEALFYEEAARELQSTVGNIKVCVHRLRKRYGAILREEVARTVATLDDVQSELEYIREILVAVHA